MGQDIPVEENHIGLTIAMARVLKNAFNATNDTLSITGNISSTLNHGGSDVVSAGTEVQLDNQECREVTIIAKDTNSGYIYIGGTGVTITNYGVRLAPSDSFSIPINNVNLVYINADNDGEGVTYIAI